MIVHELAALSAALLYLAPAPGPARELTYELLIAGKRVGYCRTRSVPTPRGIEATESTVIKVALLGTPGDLSYRSSSTLDPRTGAFRRYVLSLTRGADTVASRCELSGSRMRAEVTMAGATQIYSVPWDRRAHLLEGNSIGTWNALFQSVGALRAPTRVRLFDPTSAQLTSVTLTPRAMRRSSGSALRPVECTVAGQPILFLLDPRRREVVELRAPSQQAVFRRCRGAVPPALHRFEALAQAFATVDVDLPDGALLNRLLVRCRCAVVAERPRRSRLHRAPQSFRGRVTGQTIDGVFDVRPVVYRGAGAPPFPVRSAHATGLRRYLRDEPMVEVRDPAIRALATSVTAGATTTWEATQRLGAWVHKNIRYTITGAGARRCLAERKGDCGPHAWLTIALCRAVGIPARLTGGVLYSRALGGSFGQHYWTSVWMGADGWVPIDTTTGEIGRLSPTHITLWDAGGVGSLEVKVLAFAPMAPAAPLPRLVRRRLDTRAGDAERWKFAIDGKALGEQTATCTAVRSLNGRQVAEWSFDIRLHAPGDPSQAVSHVWGTLALTDLAEPVTLSVRSESGTSRQQADYRFGRSAVGTKLTVGDLNIERRNQLNGDEMLQLNNLITAMSLNLQALDLKPGTSAKAPMFAAQSLQRIDVDVKCRAETESIERSGKRVACLVCDVPIFGNTFYVDAVTRRLLRVVAPTQRLAIDLE